jgi:hypothetical protein
VRCPGVEDHHQHIRILPDEADYPVVVSYTLKGFEQQLLRGVALLRRRKPEGVRVRMRETRRFGANSTRKAHSEDRS